MTPQPLLPVQERSALRALAGYVFIVLAIIATGPADFVWAGQRSPVALDLSASMRLPTAGRTQVIVSGDRARIEQLAARRGLRVRRLLDTGAVLEGDAAALSAVASEAGVAHVAPDRLVVATMSVDVAATGADQVWRGQMGAGGYTGRGVGVAVIDSGIAPHADLRDAVVARADFTGEGGGDRYGHGTHLAGIIASRDRRLPGVAPGAHLIDLKVLGADGAGLTSNVVAALEWSVANARRYRIKVVNLALGQPIAESWTDDPLVQAVERAVSAGLVVVTSAGNLGKTGTHPIVVGGVMSPGNAPAAITVGALNTKQTARRSDDGVATYSSRGPTFIDHIVKPDVVAPGNTILSLKAGGSFLEAAYSELHAGGEYLTLSGTSQASAMVAGAAALMLEANPALAPAQTKFALQVTASFLPDAGVLHGGAGSVNIPAAAAVAVSGPIRPLPRTVIGGEAVASGGLAYNAAATSQVSETAVAWGDTLVWGD